ncbi:hypothetical protein ACFL6Y_10830 [Elusimicrobiota bacterium]
MTKKIFCLLLSASILCVLGRSAALAQQVNLQVSPPPIAYPYFEPGRKDFKFTGTYFSLSANNFNAKGGGLNGIVRGAFNETLALDGQMGLMGMSGEMPGFALPFWYSNTLWTPIIDGKGDLSGIMFPMSANLEVQVANSPKGSFLMFGGPSMSFSKLSLSTPYHARAGATNASKTRFIMDYTMFLFGVQFGAQGSIPAGDKVKFAPFLMMTTQGGSSSFTFKHGYSGVRSLITGGVSDIEPFTTSSIGMDIIIVPWNLSLGTLIQQAAANKDQEGFKTTLIQLSWHFRS